MDARPVTGAASLRRLLAPRALLAAGATVAALTIAIATAERLGPRFLDAAARLTLPWLVLVAVVVALAAALPAVRSRLVALGAAAAAAPAAAALAVVVALATSVQVVRGATTTLPIVLGDELIYSGLAKGVALDGELRFRGALHFGHSVLYPVAVGPFYAAAGDAVGALLAVKVFQALLMALAAVPAYLVTRRVASHGWSLAVAALSALVPWAGYATLVTTEALFYPLFVLLAYATTTMLERPTAARQAATLALAVAAALVKPQAVVLLPAIAAAAAVFAATARRPAELRRHGFVLGALAVVAAAAGATLVAGANAPGGAYGALLDDAPAPGAVLRWAAWNVAAFSLALGVAAAVAFPLALGRLLRRDASRAERALGATSASFAAFVLVSVTVLSAGPYGLGILHERSLFFLAPLVLACVARWLELRVPRRTLAAAASALAVVALVAAVPERFVERANSFDYPALRPFTTLLEHHPGVSPAVWLVGAALAGAVVLLATRGPVAPFAAVVVAFASLSGSVSWRDGVSTAEARRLTWIDRALPGSARATLLHVDFPPSPTGTCGPRPWYEQQAFVVWTEFFNVRVDRVLHLYGPIRADGVPSPELTVAEEGGILLTERGQPVETEYVVLDSRQAVSGTRVRRLDLAAAVPGYRDGASLSLWRAERPLRLAPRPSPLPGRPDGRACR